MATLKGIKVLQKRFTTVEWANYTLDTGELGLDLTTGVVKFGTAQGQQWKDAKQVNDKNLVELYNKIGTLPEDSPDVVTYINNIVNNQIKPGYVVVNTLEDRNNIALIDRIEGLHVYVNALENVYLWSENSWQQQPKPIVDLSDIIAGVHLIVNKEGKLEVYTADKIEKNNPNLATSGLVYDYVEGTLGTIEDVLTNI